MTEAEEQGGKKSCRGWWVRKMELMAVGHLAQGVFPYCPSRQLVPSEKKENQLPMATASDCGQWLVWCGSAWAPLKMLPDARTIRAGWTTMLTGFLAYVLMFFSQVNYSEQRVYHHT